MFQYPPKPKLKIAALPAAAPIAPKKKVSKANGANPDNKLPRKALHPRGRNRGM
jgi:hypothetical protein